MSETVELTRAEYLGRVVFTAGAMPAVAPVYYVLIDDEVIFRVPPDGPLASATHNGVVGFQADDIDPATHTGWGVLGIGLAHEVTEVTDLNRHADLAADWGPTGQPTLLPSHCSNSPDRGVALSLATASGAAAAAQHALASPAAK